VGSWIWQMLLSNLTASGISESLNDHSYIGFPNAIATPIKRIFFEEDFSLCGKRFHRALDDISAQSCFHSYEGYYLVFCQVFLWHTIPPY